MENKKRADQKKQQEDIALTRALIWFSAAMLLELLLLLVNKCYVDFKADTLAIKLAVAMGTVLKITAVAGLAGAVLVGMRNWKRMKEEGSLPFMGVVTTVFLLAVGVGSALIVAFYRPAVQLLYLLVPAGAVLALVYYLYQREFFFSACGIGVGMLGLWLVRKNIGTHNLLVAVYTVFGAVVLAAILLLVLKLKKNSGALEIAGQKSELLPAQSNFMLIIVSCVVSLAAMLAGFLLGGTVAFYLMFVLLSWLFVLLVYYTVKMM